MNDKGKELWRKWWDYSGGKPWVHDTTDRGLDDSCFFCGNYRHEEHDENCVYLLVAELLGETPGENESNE